MRVLRVLRVLSECAPSSAEPLPLSLTTDPSALLSLTLTRVQRRVPRVPRCLQQVALLLHREEAHALLLDLQGQRDTKGSEIGGCGGGEIGGCGGGEIGGCGGGSLKHPREWLGAQWADLFVGVPSCPEPPGAP